MGTDTLKPFLDFADRGTVILCRTSNPSSGEIQELKPEGREVYKYVARYASSKWNYNRNVLLVIGATYPDELGDVRQICPDIPFLVPGIGAQGGDLQGVVEKGLSADGKGLIINSSRGIIYSGKGKDYAEAAGTAALELKNAINRFRQ
jgi:orotidine-5'-phosphate decarboxylase